MNEEAKMYLLQQNVSCFIIYIGVTLYIILILLVLSLAFSAISIHFKRKIFCCCYYRRFFFFFFLVFVVVVLCYSQYVLYECI